MQQADSMSPLERRAAISLALVFAFRMLGLFMAVSYTHLTLPTKRIV